MYLQILSFAILVLALGWLLLQCGGSLLRTKRDAARREAELKLLENTLLIEREKRERAKHTVEAWNGYRKFTVIKKVQQGGGICSFYLEAHDRKPIADFKNGQYLTFQLNIPDQAKPVVRCYSLSDCFRGDHYRVSIKATPSPRGKPEIPPCLVSNYFHEQLEEGSIVDARAPSGHFFFHSEPRRPVVLIGGGVGLTPVLSMLNQLSMDPDDREIWFFYGVRNSSEHVMLEEMEAAASRCSNVHLVYCYSKPLPEDTIGGKYVEGRISVDLFKEKMGTSNYDYYICGPGPLMESMINGLKDWGVPDAHVNFETFGPSSLKDTKKALAPDAAPAAVANCTVEFRKSGKKVKWDGSSDNILELAESVDVSIDSGCRAGSCGSCQIAVVSGKVTYPEEPDFDPEAGTCLTCIGLPSGDVVIDA